MIPVIANKDDDCVVGELQAVECIEHDADLGIHETGRGMIRLQDFAAEIVRVCRERGVKNIHDSGVCTACDLERYYSYRAEEGKTGRMLALLAMGPGPNAAASALSSKISSN